MKNGLIASKELMECFRDHANLEDHSAKALLKLAHKAGSGCQNTTFSPIWILFKSTAERLSDVHLKMMQTISDLVKNIAKYCEELHKKHKLIKEEESSTLELAHSLKESKTVLQKMKDTYNAKLAEMEKLRKDGSNTKEMEKMEIKLKKAQDELNSAMEKHNLIKMEYKQKMTGTCKVGLAMLYSVHSTYYIAF